MEQKITIHYDFTNGTELPYQQAKQAMENGRDFNTHCLEFFSIDNPGCVIVRRDNSFISVRNLLLNDGRYTVKEIRREHNIHRMFIAGSFQQWERPINS